jgi:hypothetical protein
MKKWITGILIILGIAIGAEYYLIPAHLHITSSRYVKCSSRPAADLLFNSSNWNKWWSYTSEDTIRSTHSVSFYIANRSPFAAAVSINEGSHDTISSVISIILYKNDSTGIEWKCDLDAGIDPYNRIVNYYRAVNIKKSMDEFMNAFAGFSGNDKNVYGVSVDKRKFKDTFMISTQTTVSTQPNNQLIYSTIEKLNNYASSNGAHAINPPMLNIDSTSPGVYTLKLAIPINKEIPTNDSFRFRFMIQGNTLFAQVTGGPKTIENAIRQMRLYIGDYHYSSPAIPFESLVTDRSKETDTAKWVTNIFYPVM